MDLKQIEAFLTVMSTGSMTRAGQLLERSQSAVTRQVQELEDQLGFTLFHRNGPKLVPTAQAHQLRVDAERTVKASHQMLMRARDLLHGEHGRLQVAAIPSLACALVPQALARLPAALLPTAYEIHSLPPDDVVRAMFSQDVQLGLVNFPLDYRGLDVQWLGEAGCVAVLPAGSPFDTGGKVSLRSLGGQPLITHRASARLRSRINTAMAGADIDTARLIEANSPLVGVQMARAGLGIAVLEPYTASSLPLDGIVVRPLDVHIPFYIGLISPQGASQSETVRALSAELLAQAQALLPDFVAHDPERAAQLFDR